MKKLQFQVGRIILIPFLSIIAVSWLSMGHLLPRGIPISTPQPAPETIRSLFAEDICSPPCWFGITPGESTAEDVIAFFQSPENRFFSDIYVHDVDGSESGIYNSVNASEVEELVNGWYGLQWPLNSIQVMNLNFAGSTIGIHEGVVDGIRAGLNRIVTLEQALDILGPPDEVRASIGIYNSTFVYLFYYGPRLRVDLEAFADTCTTANLGRSFWVNFARYYADETELLTYWPGFETMVPPETWDILLRGEIDIPCSMAWGLLPQVP